jgi:putative membrane protein
MREWVPVGLVVAAQIGYPLVHGQARDVLTVATVVAGFTAAVVHCLLTRGVRVAALVVLITAGGGLLVEAVGTATGRPFGAYDYAPSLGTEVLGVPWVIPLAWTMMAWPAWVVAGRLRGPRILLAGWALASWDVFLDPQMVAAGHWVWTGMNGTGGTATLPGVPAVPLTNYLGWVVVAVAMAALVALVPGVGGPAVPGDGPMLAFYLWTYFSCVLAHAAFLGLPASAGWGALAMGTVALPLAAGLARPALSRPLRVVGR